MEKRNLSAVNDLLRNNQKLSKYFALILFGALILIGIITYRDYGIGMDEPMQRRHAVVAYRWLNRTFFDRGVLVHYGSEEWESEGSKYYGVAIQLPLVFAEDVYQLVTHEPMPIRTIFHMRHLYCYFIFVFSLFCFYRMVKDMFGSELLAAAGVLMIFSFGRFFAEAFLNIKDVVFSSLCVITLFYAERILLTKYEKKWGILFAIATAFTVSSRLAAAIIPLLLIVFILVKTVIRHEKFPLKILLLICLAYPVWLLITPASWTDPLGFSLGYVTTFSDYNAWDGVVLFEGKYLWKDQVPGDYWFRWIGMTVPLVYLLFSVCGIIFFLGSLVLLLPGRGKRDFPVRDQMLLMMFLIIFGTFLYKHLKHPTVYNGWRHAYYLYSMFIMFAVYTLFRLFVMRTHIPARCGAALLGAAIVYNLAMIAANHPAEYAAFNPIGRRVSDQYEGDYWGLSVYQCMDWLSDYDREWKTLNGYYSRTRGFIRDNFDMLTEEQRGKLSIPSVDTKYLIVLKSGNGICEDEAAPQIEGYREIYVVTSYGGRLASVYQKE
ncbi:MAG: hypothetical protein II969_16310 [Anaerolineaceae bacterium]|nr:hypothetical protein [Anaerolineaceae bacterium]